MVDNNYESLISNFINNRLFYVAEQTKKTYKYNIKRFCRWSDSQGLNINNLTEEEIKKYAIYLTSKNITTIRQQMNTILRFIKFSTCKEFNIKDVLSDCNINKVNSINVENKKKINLSNIENVKNLIKVAIERTREDDNLRDGAILNIFLCAGLRVGEVERLNITDLKEKDLGAYLDVNVHKEVDRYGHSTRRIPIEPKCAQYIKEYIKLRSDSNCAMFLNKNGQRLSVRGIQDILKKYGVSGQLLRRTFIMNLIDKGVNATKIASLMGYKSLEIVSRYFNSNNDYEYTAFKNLSELYNKYK